MSGDIELINLETGERMTCDHYKLMELGMPEGFVEIEDVTTEQWIEATGWNNG